MYFCLVVVTSVVLNFHYFPFFVLVFFSQSPLFPFNIFLLFFTTSSSSLAFSPCYFFSFFLSCCCFFCFLLSSLLFSVSSFSFPVDLLIYLRIVFFFLLVTLSGVKCLSYQCADVKMMNALNMKCEPKELVCEPMVDGCFRARYNHICEDCILKNLRILFSLLKKLETCSTVQSI